MYINYLKDATAAKKNINGFEYLRALGCTMVVLWHSGAASILAVNSFLERIVDIISFNFLLLAVPIFVQVSLFLFNMKRATSESYFQARRMPRLIALYFFWLSIRLIVDLVTGIPVLPMLDSVVSIVLTLVTGANSEVYFVFELIILTTISEGTARLFSRLDNERYQSVNLYLLIVSCIITISLPTIALGLHIKEVCLWWNPLNFLPYVFSSAIIWNEFHQDRICLKNRRIRSLLVTLLLVFIVSSVVEWCFLDNPAFFEFKLPQYSRLSSIVGSSFLMYLALMKHRKASGLVRQLSDNSAGIYFVHRYFVNKVTIGFLGKQMPNNSSFANLIVFISGFLLSFFISGLLRRAKLLRAVT